MYKDTDKVVLITDNDDLVVESSDDKNQTKNKEKIIIAVLSVVFLILLCGVIWDLYGRKTLTIYLCGTEIATSTAGLLGTSTPKDLSIASQNTASPETPPATPSGVKKSVGNTPLKPSGNTTASITKPSSSVAYSSYGTCIENAKDLGSSKDCCDCLSADVSVRKACRDFAATYDFTKNTTIKTFTIPSSLGRTGNYTAYTSSATQQECKQKCDSSTTLQCGDFQFCRTACDSMTQ